MPPARKPHLKFSATILSIILVFAFFLPFFATPRPAQALPGEAMVASMAAAVWTYVKNHITDALKTAKKTAADVAFKNALKVYMTQFAQDTAVWLASAGTGQKPLFITDPHYFKNLTDAAAGDFLDTVGSKFGVDVCAPIDLKTQFSIQSAVNALVDPANFCTNQCKRENDNALKTDTFIIGEGSFVNRQFVMTLPDAEKALQQMKADVAGGLPGDSSAEGYPTICDPGVLVSECIAVYEKDIQTYKQVVNQDYRNCLNLCSANKRVARCTFSQIQANAEKVGGQIKNKDFIPKFTTTFDPGENDIGQILTLAEKAKDAVAQKMQEDQAKRGNSDIQPLVDKVTGEVKTPRSLVGAAAQKGITQDPSGSIFSTQTGSPIADAIGVFTNTLTQRLLKRIFEQGFNPKSNPQAQFSSQGGGSFSGAQSARTLFSTLAKTEFSSGGVSTTLSELSACPDFSPGPNNCVIDDGFRQAIERGMTIKEAVDAHLLHDTWIVGYKYSATNVEPTYLEGYPYRSILILRRLRILPVGWELAAQYMRDIDTNGSTAAQRTLGYLMSAYTESCKPNGDNPQFCGLIDPNWVLKSPETFCRVSGASAAMTSLDYIPDSLFPDAPQVQEIGRANVCADEQTCIAEDENGSCRAYGYCLKERPSWKFSGDQCTAAYHSCETFADSSKSEFSYLSATLNFDNCTATNAGCKWYCSDFDTAGGKFTCTTDSGNKEKFTAKVSSCPADSVGCTEYIETEKGTNLVANGGFETMADGNKADDGASDTFPGWMSTGAVTEGVSESNSGAIGAKVTGNSGQELQSIFDTKFPLNGQSMTLSLYGKRSDATDCSGYFGLRTMVGGNPYFKKEPVTFTSNWQRFTTTLTFDPGFTYDSSVVTTFVELSNCSATLDDVQTEFGTKFSKYTEYGSVNKIYLNGNRQSCQPEEVGCDFYSSATDKIPGVVTSADYCPADQVGCRAFLEVPITNNGADPAHPVRTGKRCSLNQEVSCANDSDCSGIGQCLPSVSLIPKTGKTCSAANVGCEQYTNLDEVARGGEGIEYYSYIRECVKPNGDPSNEKTYYTWVGDQQSGFQLKAYLLQPTSNLIGEDTVGGGPAYNAGADPTQCTEAIFDAGDNPDCRKFYDASLDIYFRLYSFTISVSDDCHPFRNAIDNNVYNAIPSEGRTCPAEAAQCREYRGASGFNTRTILKDNFDDGDTLGWDGAQWSGESLIFGGGSAQVNQTLQTNQDLNVSSQLQKGRSYIVSFWAGSSNAGTNNTSISARFAQSPAGEQFDGTATIHWDSNTNAPEWNYYTLGPLHLDRDPSVYDPNHPSNPVDDLQFSLSSGNGYYMDNIKLLEVSDNLYLTKGSYHICTGNENCDVYRNSNNTTVYLKSFTRLCSEDKVGCEALINTQNSDSPFTKTYSSPDGSEMKTVSGDVIDLMVNNPKNYCKNEEQGCTQLGSPTLGSPGFFCSNDNTRSCTNNSNCVAPGTCQFQSSSIKSYDTVFLVNDPDQYSNILCWGTELGCDAWTSKLTGVTKYFHRPEPYTCDYKTVTFGGQSFTDWYRTGTSGMNAGDACPVVNAAPPGQGDISPVSPYTQPTGFCKGNPQQHCSGNGDCAPSDQCIRWVGVCPAEQSGCKEYRDTSDPGSCRSDCLLTLDQNGENVPIDNQCQVDKNSSQYGCRGYWYLSQSVEQNASECNGAVDPNLGCRQFYSPDPQ